MTLEGFEMLRFSGIRDDRPFLGFGLSELNLTRLVAGQPICQSLDVLGLPLLDVYIVYGVEMAVAGEAPDKPYLVEDSPLGSGFVAPIAAGEGAFVMFTGEREGRLFLGFGLTAENLADLRSGVEIKQDLSLFDLGELDAILIYGLTEDAIQRRLETESGLLPRRVVDQRTSAQRRGNRKGLVINPNFRTW
jgi:hypothetical protein